MRIYNPKNDYYQIFHIIPIFPLGQEFDESNQSVCEIWKKSCGN